MLAVGVLVPLDARKLGKSFVYAQELKELARQLIDNLNNHDPLEKFWEEHHSKSENEQRDRSESHDSDGYQKTRAPSISILTSPSNSPTLPAHHPALALPELLTMFGPLLFPLFRAALLQKRILILGEAPVEHICNAVYSLSVLSSLPRSTVALLPHFEREQPKYQPLFNIGVADIPYLHEAQDSWIACTTDDVLATKPQLFDMLVILPTSTSTSTSMGKVGNKVYPKLIYSTPQLSKQFPKQGVRASQRDARKYLGLKENIQRLDSSALVSNHINSVTSDDDASTTSSISTVADHREAVEPASWTVIAYTSLIWWVSAGDRRSGLLEAEELVDEQDEALLRDAVAGDIMTKEVAMVAYFQKLSTLIFSVLRNAVDRSTPNGEERYRDNDGEDAALLSQENDKNEDLVDITEEDIRAMGLNVWSESDKHFIQEMVAFWWKKEAVVHGGTVECCGVRFA
ncbi:hypothetical protein LTS08_005090 [Lithohypha guttulata]|nr:hypothetical protein LTS08_005090 [Lithohypha guttulata]